jgi:hypothetical protein
MVAGSYGIAATQPFDAPAGALLVAGYAGSGGDIPAASGITWTLRKESVNKRAKLWTAPVPTAKPGLQVTLTGSNPIGGLKVWLVTGHEPGTYVGRSGAGTSTTNDATVTGYAATRLGSLGFCVASEHNTTGSATARPSSTDVAEGYTMAEIFSGAGNGLFVRKAVAAAAAEQAVTFNLNAPGTAAANWEWAALEILGPADAEPPSTPPNLRVVEVTGTSLTVGWDPSTDNLGVSGYGVWLDGVKVAGP